MIRHLVLCAVLAPCSQVSCSTSPPARAARPESGEQVRVAELDEMKRATAEKRARASGEAPAPPGRRVLLETETPPAPRAPAEPTPRSEPPAPSEPTARSEPARRPAPSGVTRPATGEERSSAMDDLLRARERKTGELGEKRDDVESFSEEDERVIGEATVRSLLTRLKPIPLNSAPSVYVRKVGAVLAQSSGRRWIPYRFVVLESDSVNAFAAPYGYVFVTTGALRFARNEAELAFIIAHEIAHVERKHGLEHILRAYYDVKKREARGRLDELSRPLEGDAKEKRDALQKRMDELSDLVLKGYGLPHEEEADRIGLRIVSRAGYDPSASLELLARMGEAGKGETDGPRLFQSHPSSAERLARARGAVARLPRGGVVAAERFRAATSRL